MGGTIVQVNINVYCECFSYLFPLHLSTRYLCYGTMSITNFYFFIWTSHSDGP